MPPMIMAGSRFEMVDRSPPDLSLDVNLEANVICILQSGEDDKHQHV